MATALTGLFSFTRCLPASRASTRKSQPRAIPSDNAEYSTNGGEEATRASAISAT